MKWFVEVLKKYAVFEGRAHRTEYWMFILFYVLIAVVLAIIEAVLGIFGLNAIFALALLLPSLAVTVRRLHDTDRSGWWLLIGLVPLAGIVLLVFMLLPSNEADNPYGPRATTG
ncbi:MAG: DUF805 domain-containing protein [Desulfatitalea sp.]|nr:DUF805 domain-containing protein [Desulfatitalea sp.]NNK01254.1 DUF805 domain-containing protein [Desulfatitalea sp.]